MKKITKLSIALALLLALALPIMALAGNVTSYTSGFQIQNLSSTDTANVTISFYNQDGTVEASPTDTISASDSNTYYPLAAVSDGFNGSVVISSDQPVAAIANVLGNDGAHGASYVGFEGGAQTVNLPLVMKDNYGIDTWFNVQNTGTAAADVDVTYGGTACTDSATIEPSASHTFDQAADTCLSAGYVGAAQVTADQDVVVAVIQVTNDSSGLMPGLLAYNGFTTESTSPVMPLVSSGYYGSGTGTQIMNTGASSTDVTLTYTPSAGFPGATCTETKTITAGNSVTFGFPSMASSCYTDDTGGGGPAAFVGSAQVTTNSASQNLVAIVNQVTTGQSTAAAYGAFSPADATDTVSLPLIMDRNYGIFTGFSVANVGTVNTDITCTFSGTSYTASATNVAPGQALTDVQSGVIADGYVGSAVCVSTGESIAVVVNQLNTGSVLTVEDGLLVFEGINY